MDTCQACGIQTDDSLVQCDRCDSWWHFGCVGVSDSISEKSFICTKCFSATPPPPPPHHNEVLRLPPTDTMSVSSRRSSISNASARARLNLERLEVKKVLAEKMLDLELREQERKIELARMQKEGELERRKLELQRDYEEEKLRLMEEELLDAADRSLRSQQSSNSKVRQWRSQMQLGGACSTMQSPAANEVLGDREAPTATTTTTTTSVERITTVSGTGGETSGRQPAGDSGIETATHSVARMATGTGIGTVRKQPSNSAHKGETVNSFPPPPAAPPNQVVPERYRNEFPVGEAEFGPETATTIRPAPVIPAQRTACGSSLGLSGMRSDPPTSDSQWGNSFEVQQPSQNASAGQGSSSFVTPSNPERQPGTHVQSSIRHPVDGPSSTQLAARQVMPRDLPMFSGNPEDWPVFISSFANSSQACGYTDAENLIRLQRCLKGPALEAVKSRLLFPAAVPHVIATLETLYGKPEHLIFMLLKKVREVPAPRPDKLETLIGFGIAVQNLCDHVEMGQQVAHLNNPTLLYELVDKLPANLKLDWAMFKQQAPITNLRTFAQFMSRLVTAAADVTLHMDPRTTQRGKPEKSREKNFLGAHSGSRRTEYPTKSDVPVGQSTRSGNFVTCLVCKEPGHKVRECKKFADMTVENRWKAVQTHSLCRTCIGAHGKRPCKSKKLCDVDGCQARHHSLLHSDVNQVETETAHGITNHHFVDRSSLFRILPVTLYANNRSIMVYAFLDDGSSRTLIEEDVVKYLGNEGEVNPLCLQWTANVKRIEKKSMKVSLEISGEQKTHLYQLVDVRTVNRLDLPRQSIRYTEMVKKYPYLGGLPIKDYEDAVPKILIGNDNSYLAAVLKIREGNPQEPIAAKTRLGWTIYGSVPDSSKNALTFHICSCESDSSLHELVKQYFSVESLGVKIVDGLQSREIQRANRILESSTKRIGQRYETGLLWRFDVFEFPDSYQMAVKRMVCLERRMAKNATIGESVRKQMVKYQEKGYIHRATEAELKEADPRRTWYLPLGVALNPKKPEKIRIFCDAAAMVDGVSLNSMLLKGPDLLSSLPAVLFGFRERRYALCADIKEMFHQIRIKKEDQHAQRLLWRDSPDEDPAVYIMDVATFGSTCSPCSAQYVKNINAVEHAAEFPAAAEAVIKKHYVDDYLDSADTIDEAVRQAEEVRIVHSRGGFHIRNWMSNSEEVLRRVGEPSMATKKHLSLDKSGVTERILGMLWCPDKDEFTYSTTLEVVTHPPTKRIVLRAVMSLFDPLGLMSFFVIHGKVLIQDIWRAKTNWDEPIPERLCRRWFQWTKLCEQLNCVRIGRCYFPDRGPADLESLQLHVFVDASEGAYACVAYFRAVYSGKVECALVAAKSKVAPLKSLSIPRMELQAAILGVRLKKMIREAHSLPIDECFYHTDSKNVLAWINSDHRNYRQYVAVRIGEILTESNEREWRWIPTKENVADDATKWGNGPCFSPACRWFRGPEFLYRSEEEWPVDNQFKYETSEEIRACLVHREDTNTETIEWSRFSNWKRLWRSVAYVQRFLSNLRKKVRGEPLQYGTLTQEELIASETSIWRQVQEAAYGEELRVLETAKRESVRAKLERNSKLRQLSPFLDTAGVLRSESRIQKAYFASYDTRCPIILPKDNPVTVLLVESYHRKYLHANGETVLNEMRQRFYISGHRTLIRSVTKRCNLCRIRKAVPIVPRMAPLPSARLQAYVRPFSYVGLDYCGPLAVRVGRATTKRWIALFTCLTIRAVHLEVVHSLSTESCKLAVRRFVARRGAPSEVYSDNGTNFVGASNELRREIENIGAGLAETFTNTHTKWCFNPPSAPHMGGSWERLVRSIKTALEAMYTTRTPDEETFATLIIEAEAVVNSRPLTFIPVDPGQREALTPNHFLLMSSSGVTQPARALEEASKACRNSWNLCRVMVDSFWRRWIREYLTTIARRTRWFEDVKPVDVGDLVIVLAEGIRNGWTRGRTLEVIRGTDGRVRQAIVQTSTGVIRRPVAKLARLDIDGNIGQSSSDPSYGSGNVADLRATVECPSSELPRSSI
ncbi:uncharacterized protein LOC134292262 [Aedes albopictus]|uniref:Uncharacterized protein n=1 Tax=Aedes albopictus TaxID=7160 RepID=A0ABM1XWB2_AEDAL